MSAVFAKLDTGAWGVRVEGEAAKSGDAVTVARRDGQTRDVELGALVSTTESAAGDKVFVFEVGGEKNGRAPRGKAKPRSKFGPAPEVARALASMLDVVEELAFKASKTKLEKEWAAVVHDTFELHRAELRGEDVTWPVEEK